MYIYIYFFFFWLGLALVLIFQHLFFRKINKTKNRNFGSAHEIGATSQAREWNSMYKPWITINSARFQLLTSKVKTLLQKCGTCNHEMCIDLKACVFLIAYSRPDPTTLASVGRVYWLKHGMMWKRRWWNLFTTHCYPDCWCNQQQYGIGTFPASFGSTRENISSSLPRGGDPWTLKQKQEIFAAVLFVIRFRTKFEEPLTKEQELVWVGYIFEMCYMQLQMKFGSNKKQGVIQIQYV